MLAEAAQETEQDSRPLTKLEKDRLNDVKDIIIDLDDEDGKGTPVEVVYQRAKSKFDMSQEQTEKVLERLRSKGEVYSISESHILAV